METLKKINRIWIIIVPTLLALSCYIIAHKIVNSMDFQHNDNDFFTFWLAGRLMTQGESPYDVASWNAGYQQFQMGIIPNPAFLYPLPLALFFAPLGLLSLHQAYTLWVALSEIMIIVALWMLLSINRAPGVKQFFMPLLVGIIFFRPTILTLVNGQISGWLLLLLTGIACLWEKGKWEWGSLLLALLMLKPNIGAPLILLLGIWLLFQKRYKAILFIFLGGIALLLIGVIQNPRWIIEYWTIGNLKLVQTFGASPTVWGLSALIFRNNPVGMIICGSLGTLLLVLGFFATVLRPSATRKPLTIFSLAITVTLLVTPYTWTYDQILLLIPIIGVTLAMHQAGHRFAFTASIFLMIDFVAFLLVYPDFTLGIEILNAIIPLIVLGFCTWWIKVQL